ncbi:GNAT family N-acetyltransferase [Corallococcus carmarthensis]|uniref:N-acetyltransferase n=1 Tax=Corallococcus carmarthensis TaxID=2316728 RepID=A0A3A8KJT1_9BACT|nr:GNAT family protein [Corallococcus carmarthensis]NOK15699.1 GNAT family N-acetyltransferase [Corallococcus carmarthensis]RKH07379.1 N-acetyltransferase [Corallococcus carmarthensis]
MSAFFADRNVVLEDERVRLRPLVAADVDALAEVAFDPAIWKFFVASIQTRDDLQRFVDEGVESTRAGTALAFTVVDKASGAVVGSTRFGNLSARDQRVEVGWTWLGRKFQGTGTNTRCKQLLMAYAFEQQGVQRTEFKTDVLNQPARRALLKVGCTEEGVLRSHTLMPGGRRRDTIYYSVLAGEWPGVKQRLSDLIKTGGGGPC